MARGIRWTESDLAATGEQLPGKRKIRRRGVRQLEHLEQVAFLKWCEHQLINHRCDDGRHIKIILADVVEASLNGAYLQGDRIQRAKQWSRMKSAGAKKSAPDLSVNYPRNGFAGLKIEMKRSRDSFSCASQIRNARRAGQAEYLHLMERLGYMTGFAYGWAEAAVMVCVYMGWDPRQRGVA